MRIYRGSPEIELTGKLRQAFTSTFIKGQQAIENYGFTTPPTGHELAKNLICESVRKIHMIYTYKAAPTPFYTIQSYASLYHAGICGDSEFEIKLIRNISWIRFYAVHGNVVWW